LFLNLTLHHLKHSQKKKDLTKYNDIREPSLTFAAKLSFAAKKSFGLKGSMTSIFILSGNPPTWIEAKQQTDNMAGVCWPKT